MEGVFTLLLRADPDPEVSLHEMHANPLQQLLGGPDIGIRILPLVVGPVFRKQRPQGKRVLLVTQQLVDPDLALAPL